MDINVLFVASSAKTGKIGNVVQNQADSLLFHTQIKIDYFAINKSGIIGYLSSIFKLRIQLENKKYDLIHAHFGFSGIVSLLAKKKHKLIVSFMGDDILGSIRINGKYSIQSRFFSIINRLLCKYFYDFTIVKSNNLYAKLSVNNSNVVIIPNGVDLKLFYEIDAKVAKKYLSLLEDKYYILFVGDPKRMEKNFNLAKKAVDFINMPSIVLFNIHTINSTEMFYYYSAASCLLMTSFHEGSPNVIKEALACNCPVVSTDVGDVKELIGNTKGCFITSYEYEDVAQKILSAINFSTIYNRTNGRKQIIEKKLDSENIAKRIVNLYKTVLN